MGVGTLFGLAQPRKCFNVYLISSFTIYLSFFAGITKINIIELTNNKNG